MNPKKVILIATVATMFALLLVGTTNALPASADTPTLNWGSQLNRGQCPRGNLVVDVTFKVTNDGDTYFGPGFWALDNYNKHIQVVQVSQDSFCAVVEYVGSFTTIGDTTGPAGGANGGTLSSGVGGTMQGGYRSTVFHGTLNPKPAYRTRGNIGTFNYACSPTDPGNYSTCTTFDWIGAYFSSAPDFGMAWWGWIYRAGKHGTWVNSIDGSFGNIAD